MARVGGWRGLLLVAVFVVGYLLVASVVLVRGRLLDADLYTGALARNDAYDRVYTEVLADPELAEVVEDLLGGLQVDALDPVQVRALSTSALRWTVPPSTLRRGTETFLAAVLGYVRGDVARLDGDVDVSGVLERIDDSAVVEVRALLAGAADQVAADADGYRVAVATFADRLASGAVPAAVPVPADGADPTQVADAVLARLGPTVDPRVREQLVAAVASGDARDGLINATDADVARVAATARSRLGSALEDGRDLDVVTELADRAGRSKATVVDRLDAVRDAARWLGPATGVLGAVLMVGAGVGLWRLRPGLLAVAAVAAGLTVLVLWLVVTRVVGSPLEPATTTGPGSWHLPAGLRALVADVESTVARELTRTARRLVLVPVVAGALVAVAPRLRIPRVALLPATAVVAFAGLVLVAVDADDHDDERLCNGHAELCDRRYDQVVYAATHNSMSSPDVVFVWPEQDGDIRSQLDAGVRALLIDTHHWTPLLSAEQLTAADPYLPPSVAQQAFGVLGPLREGRDGTFLCHNECALGAVALGEALETIRSFLDDNPDDVVTLIVQDAITPEETADAFTRAGLDHYLHTHRPGTSWATLGELVDRGERLVVFAEDSGPPPSWYHPAFELLQETPYRFEQPSDFSCVANRGAADASLFLLNHWVQRVAPDRVDAVAVNAHDAIVDRARRCQRERGRLPNYLAVNFYSIGDLDAAVDTLNGLD